MSEEIKRAEDDNEYIGEDISNEEYTDRFLKKYRLYREGKLTLDDFEGFEIFLRSDMLKEEAHKSLEALDELVRERNIKLRRERGAHKE